jgi:hypothetical protein
MNELNELLNRAAAHSAKRDYDAAAITLEKILDLDGLPALVAGCVGLELDKARHQQRLQQRSQLPWYKRGPRPVQGGQQI